MNTEASAGKEVFVADGEAIRVMGPATRKMHREADALVLSPDAGWGNPLFADRTLEEDDFHIHARVTLDQLDGTGASFLIGGHYHYPCSRPEGNRAFRVSLDDDTETYDRDCLETDARIVYGMTERRAPWSSASKEIAGRTRDYIRPGEPFRLDLYQERETATLQIDGRVVLTTSLRKKDGISGAGDGGWPVCFGFLPDRATLRLHDLSAEGRFAKAFLEHAEVWSMGTDGYFTYRIPSLCVTPDGSVLAFAEARRSDFARLWGWSKDWNADEVHCVMKRSADGGSTWSDQQVILAHGSTYEARDPAPVVDWETGDVFLITRGPYILKSEDGGQTWSGPRSLRELRGGCAGMLTPGPANSGIQLCRGPHAGRLVVAVANAGDVGLMYSDNHGQVWQMGGVISGYQGYEPQAAELSDGGILVNARNHSDNPGRLILVSRDGGLSLEAYYDGHLSSQRCLASLVRGLQPEGVGGGHVFCGPGEGRRRLTVRLSEDDCESWSVAREVYSGHSAYSALAAFPDGTFGALYEQDAYRRLSFVRFDSAWLEGRE